MEAKDLLSATARLQEMNYFPIEINVRKEVSTLSRQFSLKSYFQRIKSMDINNFTPHKKDHPVLKTYKMFENSVRTDIVLWREAQQKDVDYKPSRFPISLLKENNPLEVEVKLMEMKWNFIDELEREHHFDMGFLILYFLKLQILRRFFTFNKESITTPQESFKSGFLHVLPPLSFSRKNNKNEIIQTEFS